jgi:O-antigen ligase
MRNVLASAMVITMALCVLTGIVLFGAVTVDVAAPVHALAILLALMWAAKLFFAPIVSWKPSPLHWPVLAFALYATVRYATAPIEYDARMELIQVWLLTFIYFVCASNFYRSRDRTIIFGLLLTVALAEAIYGFWQFGTRADNVLNVLRSAGYRGRASGTYICPNHLAGLLEMVITLAIGRTAIQRFSRSKVQKSALQKVFVVYLTLFLITGLIFTFSRSAWISLAVALATLWFWGEWDWRVLWPRMAVAAGTIGVIALVAFSVKPVRIFIEDTLAGEQKKDGSTLRDPTFGGRTLMWNGTLKVIQQHPVVGSGPGSWQWFFPKYRHSTLQIHPEHAHNDILQLASDYGLIGFGIVVWAFVAFFRHASVIASRNASSEQRSFAVGSGLAVTAMIVHSWFDFNMHMLANAIVLVMLMSMTVAMDDSEARYPRVELKRAARFVLAFGVLLLCGGAIWFVRPAATAVHDSSRADALRDILEWDAAVALYQKAAAVDPRFPEPYARMGQVYFSQAKWRVGEDKAAERQKLLAQSVAAFERSLELNPYQTSTIVRLAAAYELAGDAQRATQCFARAMALEPSSAFVYQQMGLFYRRAGEESEALKAFEVSTRLFGNLVSELNIMELKAHR